MVILFLVPAHISFCYVKIWPLLVLRMRYAILKAYFSGFQVGKTCVSELYTYKLVYLVHLLYKYGVWF